MSIYKNVIAKFDGYSVSLDSPLNFFQYDSLYLKIEIEVQGINNSQLLLDPPLSFTDLNIEIIIKDSDSTYYITPYNFTENSITIYLNQTFTSTLGTKQIQLKLNDSNGNSVTLPHIEYEIRKPLFELKEASEIDEETYVPVIENNEPLKMNLNKISNNKLDLSNYVTKQELNKKADIIHEHPQYLTELPYHTHSYESLTDKPSITNLEEYATISYVDEVIQKLINTYLKDPIDPDSDPKPDSDETNYEGQGTKYYVSTKGSDNNSGTNIDQPFLTINKALSLAKGGDIIYIRAGSYNEEINLTRSGSDGKYITIRNYPGEKPKIDRKSKGIMGIDLGKTSYININGLEFCNLKQQKRNGDAAIAIYKEQGGSHIIIQNCEFHDINAYSNSSGDGNWASAIKIIGVTSNTISNIIIKNNLVYNCILGWNEAIAIESNVEHVDVINNTVHDVTNIGIDILGNFGECSTPSLDQARYVNVIGNTVYNCISPYATCAGIYVDGARDVLIERNISHNNMTGIEIGAEESVSNYPVKNITVRNNLVYNNTEYGLMCGGYYSGAGIVKDTKFYNNNVIHSGSSTMIEISKTQNIEFKNNILYCTNKEYFTDHDTSLSSSISNITFNYNNIYSTGITSSTSTFCRIAGKTYTLNSFKSNFNSNYTLSNPLFKNITNLDYTLASTSPCIDAGNGDSDTLGALDLLGNKRILGKFVDLGCYEYVTSVNNDNNNSDDNLNTQTTKKI